MSRGDLVLSAESRRRGTVTRIMAEEEPALPWDSTVESCSLPKEKLAVLPNARLAARPWEINRAGVYPLSACPTRRAAEKYD